MMPRNFFRYKKKKKKKKQKKKKKNNNKKKQQQIFKDMLGKCSEFVFMKICFVYSIEMHLRGNSNDQSQHNIIL